MYIWWIIFAFTQGGGQPKSPDLPPPIISNPIKTESFCELLKQGFERSGEVIATETPVTRISSLGMVLVGENCEESLIEGDYRFPDIAVILASGPPSPKTYHLVTFQNNKAFYDLDEMDQEARKKHKQLVCRIEGLFETRPKESLWNAQTKWPRGFGHMNLARAQIVLKDVKGCQLRDQMAFIGPIQPK